jgi:hypothetical protein
MYCGGDCQLCRGRIDMLAGGGFLKFRDSVVFADVPMVYRKKKNFPVTPFQKTNISRARHPFFRPATEFNS